MLSQEQIKFFHKNGFLHIPNALGPSEVKFVQQAADRLINEFETVPAALKKDFKYGALVGDMIGEGDILCRIEYSLNKSQTFLELLGHPMIIGTAVSLTNEPIVLTWEDIIIKMAASGMGVPFHQDTLYQSLKSTVFSIGVYFDDSDLDPLYALPGTQQLGPVSEEEIPRIVAARKDEMVVLPVKAGDLLMHNVQMIHGSKANNSPKTRRVLYFEFRTVSQVLNDSPWDQDWLKLRQPYISLALQERAKNPVLVEEDSKYNLAKLNSYKERWQCDKDISKDSIRLRVPHDPEEFEAERMQTFDREKMADAAHC